MKASSVIQRVMQALTLATFLAAAGTALKITWGLPATSWPSSALGPLSTVAASALVTTTTLTVTETWNRRRRHEALEAVRQHREQAYEEIFLSLIASARQRIPGKTVESFERELRITAAAATWAHPRVLRAIDEWRNEISSEPLRNAKRELGQVALEMRADLAGDLAPATATMNDLEAAFFAEASAPRESTNTDGDESHN